MAAKRKPRKFGTGGGTELTSPSKARGDGLAQRGKTKGRFV